MRLLRGLMLLCGVLWRVYGARIGSTCTSAPTINCGSNSTQERLTCESGVCKGTYLHNDCDGNSRPCASTFYCNTQNVCTRCPEGCKVCSDSTSCSATGCLSGYYYDSTTKKCGKLGENCAAGNSPSVCTSCNSGYWLTSSRTCSSGAVGCSVPTGSTTCQTCEKGRYWDSANGLCALGPANCDLPTDKANCATCASGYYLDIVGTANSNARTCKAGPLRCDVVYPLGTCLACKTGLYLSSSGSCMASLANCKTATTATTCDVCENGYFNHVLCSSPIANCKVIASINECATCANGYFLTAAKTCSACPSLCASCTGTGNSQCSACNVGYVLSNNNCQACTVANCKSCSSSVNICTTCKDGFYLADNVCVACKSNCLTCTSASACVCKEGFIAGVEPCSSPCPTNCKSCSTTAKCSSNGCKDGFYFDPSTSLCAENICVANCKVCSGPKTCGTCLGSYYKVCGSCTGSGGVPNCKTCTSLNACSKCQDECIPNASPPTICTKATSEVAGYMVGCLEYAVTVNRCQVCQVGYLGIGNAGNFESCVSCFAPTPGYSGTVPNCKTCTNNYGSLACTECQDGYIPNAIVATTCTIASSAHLQYVANCLVYQSSGVNLLCLQCSDYPFPYLCLGIATVTVGL